MIDPHYQDQQPEAPKKQQNPLLRIASAIFMPKFDEMTFYVLIMAIVAAMFFEPSYAASFAKEFQADPKISLLFIPVILMVILIILPKKIPAFLRAVSTIIYYIFLMIIALNAMGETEPKLAVPTNLNELNIIILEVIAFIAVIRAFFTIASFKEDMRWMQFETGNVFQSKQYRPQSYGVVFITAILMAGAVSYFGSKPELTIIYGFLTTMVATKALQYLSPNLFSPNRP